MREAFMTLPLVRRKAEIFGKNAHLPGQAPMNVIEYRPHTPGRKHHG
nr:hypothetical protein [Dechloromonas sp.]